MILDVTDEQVKKMAALAVNAAKAVGLGFLQYQNGKELDASDFHIVDGGLCIDYYDGRMVKFYARKVDGKWKFDDKISPDYQSWCLTYPSYKALANVAKE